MIDTLSLFICLFFALSAPIIAIKCGDRFISNESCNNFIDKCCCSNNITEHDTNSENNQYTEIKETDITDIDV